MKSNITLYFLTFQRPNWSDRKKFLILNIIVALAYFVTARFGMMLASINHTVSPLLPATGLAFAALYTFGQAAWPSIFLGAFAAYWLDATPLSFALVIALGNTLEAWVGCKLIKYLMSYRQQYEHLAEMLAITAASILASTLSASIGAGALWYFGNLEITSFQQIWTTWWVGDMLGGLVVTPFLISCYGVFRNTWQFNIKKFIWWWMLGILTIGLIHFVFNTAMGGAYLFILFFPLLLASGLTQVNGTYFFTVLISAASVYFTVQGKGPFSSGTLNESLIHLQLFLLALSITALAISGFFRQRMSRFPALILLICWSPLGVIFYSFDHEERKKESIRFDEEVQTIHDNIVKRFNAYEDVLRSSIALFDASSSGVNLKEWARFISSMQIVDRYPGIKGIGIIWPVPHAKKEAFENAMIQEGVKDFRIKSLSHPLQQQQKPIGFHYVIKYLEPMDGNMLALGLDVATETHRREALELARDSGHPTISASIELISDTHKGPDFMLLFPIYKLQMPLSSIQERRNALIGWVCAPFIHQIFFGSILLKLNHIIELSVMNVSTNEARGAAAEVKEDILYQSNPSTDGAFEKMTYLQIGQKKFALGWRRGPEYKNTHDTIVAWVSLAAALVGLFLTSMIVSLQEISRKSKDIAEELTIELKRSMDRLNLALESAQMGVWSLDLSNFNAWRSEKHDQIFGHCEPLAEWNQQIFMDHVVPEWHERVNAIFQTALKSETASVECQIRRANDQAIRWIYIQSKIFHDHHREPKYLVGIVKDITEQKLAQRIKEKELSSLKHALDLSSIVSFLDTNGIITHVNARFCEITGYSQNELVGKNHRILSSGLHTEEFFSNMWETMFSGMVWQGEILNRTKSGNLIWFSKTIVPLLNENGDPIQYLVLRNDITEHKKSEEERQRLTANTKAAEETAKLKSEFLASMSHEIRTPLNGVIGMTDLLLDTQLDADQKKYAEIIQQSGTVLLMLINDILDYSKVEAGKMYLETATFVLSSLVETQAEILLAKAREKNISLMTFISPQIPLNLSGDPGRIGQVLLNLMGNAIKFTVNGGVAVRVFAITQRNSAENFWVRFEVVDTGMGISAIEINKLFQPFTQVQKGNAYKFGGTGLGLSICKRLVEVMGGEIGVESIVGEGSTFWFEIPLSTTLYLGPVSELGSDLDADMGSSDQVLGSATDLKNIRALVIEDDLVALDTIHRYIISWEMRNGQVSNFTQALPILNLSIKQNDPYQIAIIGRGDGSNKGFALAQLISQSLGQKAPKLIFLSELGKYTEEIDLSQKSLFVETIYKPVKQSEIFDSFMLAMSGIGKKKNPRAMTHLKQNIKTSEHRILLADDVVANQMLTLKLLQNLGYNANAVANGKEVLEAIKSISYDLILMDCQMPEMDGFEATRQLREMEKATGQHIPIIALTANAMPGDDKKCLNAGMDDYLSKPIKKDRLFNILQKWLIVGKNKKHKLVA